MLHLNRYIYIVLLSVTAMTTSAAQLGSAKGSAVFGRPLDLSVQVRLDTPFNETVNCFSAEVFQADNKFDPGQVRLDVLPLGNSLDATIRIRSTTPINEPWAKVLLRSDCGSKVSRQYNFLTDFAEATPSKTVADNSIALPTVLATQPTIAASTPSGINTQVTPPPLKVRRVHEVAIKSIPKKTLTKPTEDTKKLTRSLSPTPEIVKKSDSHSTSAVQSSLKIDAFDLTDEHQIMLKLSSALVAPTGMRTPEEVQALAQTTAVWRAINGKPAVEISTSKSALDSPTGNKILSPAPESAAKTLSTSANKSFPNLTGSNEYSNLFVYALVGLLITTLLCIAWLWNRASKAALSDYKWLSKSVDDNSEAMHEPTQFFRTTFYDDTVKNSSLQKDLAEEIEIDISSDSDAVVTQNQRNEFAPLAVSESSDDHANHSANTDTVTTQPITSGSVINTVLDSTLNSPLPANFDGIRFDEPTESHLLETKNTSKAKMSDQSFYVSDEMSDLTNFDKRVQKSSENETLNMKQLNKPSQTISSSKQLSTKVDAKNNLIDFDFFAEPSPSDKS